MNLAGYKTKIAALVIAVLAINEILPFVPESCVVVVLYLASALGLYGLRDAVERLKQKVDQVLFKG